jgi:hypothetical protein
MTLRLWTHHRLALAAQALDITRQGSLSKVIVEPVRVHLVLEHCQIADNILCNATSSHFAMETTASRPSQRPQTEQNGQSDDKLAREAISAS